MSDNSKITRDLCIETNTILKEYIKASVDRRAALDKVLEDKEKRLRTLESTASEARGGWKTLTAIGSASGIIGGLIVKYFPR